MSENSRIEWTDATFNPVWGCTKVSPGCVHVYPGVVLGPRRPSADFVDEDEVPVGWLTTDGSPDAGEMLVGQLSLSLRDPATQDRVLRWLAARVHKRTGVVLQAPVGAPEWRNIGGRWWRLGASAFPVAAYSPEGSGEGRSHRVPTLADVDTLAPEADLLALAAVVAWEVARG